MNNLLIIGARGFGREVYNIASECSNFNVEFNVKGFLDDKSDALEGFDGYPHIISSVESYIPQLNDVFICALGDVHYKKYYVKIILDKGGVFTSIIHPSSNIAMNSKIGVGCIISRYVTVSCDVNIEDFVTLSTHSGIGHDATIGKFSHIGGLSSISGGVKIEDMVTIYPGAIIAPHKIIHSNSIIGTGSVVLSNVKSGTTVFGNPAKKIDF